MAASSTSPTQTHGGARARIRAQIRTPERTLSLTRTETILAPPISRAPDATRVGDRSLDDQGSVGRTWRAREGSLELKQACGQTEEGEQMDGGKHHEGGDVGDSDWRTYCSKSAKSELFKEEHGEEEEASHI